MDGKTLKTTTLQTSSQAHAPGRQKILSVAAKLFREKGYAGTGIRDIAKACDMLPGSLHYRYKAKEDILVDMMKLAIEGIIELIVDATSREIDPLKQMKAAVRAHVSCLLSGDNMVYVLLFEWRSLRGEDAQQIIAERDRYERVWAVMLDAMKAKGYIRADVDTEIMRLIGLGAVNWVATWYKPEGRYAFDEIAVAIWNLLSRGCLDPKYHEDAAAI